MVDVAGLSERVSHIRRIQRLKILGGHGVISVSITMLVGALEPLVALLLLHGFELIRLFQLVFIEALMG